MADNPSPNTPPKPSSTPVKGGALPPLPSSGMTGKLPAPNNQLPGKRGAGKIVVMLSSVAKPAPATTQAIPKIALPVNSSAKLAPPGTARAALNPQPLPPKQVTPAKTPQVSPETKLSTTTFVKLPPKTSVAQLSSLSGRPVTTPAPAPTAKEPEPATAHPASPKKSGAQHIPPIRLNEPSTEADGTPAESIFSTTDLDKLKSEAAPVESVPKPAAQPPGLQAKEKPAPPVVAPPLLPPQRVIASPKSVLTTLPLPSPLSSKPTEPPPGHPIQVAPPMLEKTPEPIAEKLPQPLIGTEARKSEPPTVSPESPSVHRAPALVPPAMPPGSQAPKATPPKPLLPPTSTIAKVSNWLTKSKPLILSSTSRVKMPHPVVETKPALKPATLPKRALPNPDDPVAKPEPVKQPEAPSAAKTEKPAAPPVKDASKAAAPALEKPIAELKPLTAVAPLITPTPVSEKASAPIPERSAAPLGEKVETKDAPAAAPATPAVPPALPAAAKKTTTAPLPPTRAARAAKRKLWGTVVFYLVFVVTVVLMFLGALYFGRDTRVEGQIIPPAGMKLNTEVWIVTDFSSLASGIADDLAKERTPLLQEIQERQEHLQRAQADVAAREERIRLIQQQINGDKDEINATIKQSRDATQQVWDSDGAAIDSEYSSHLNQLKNAIASRAKSLNLKYQPDDSFQSAEVWANAYRLALYQVPAGVDSVKELQWLGDQMKQWRDFQKSLDDRTEQLREKAAQLKLAPAPKITDLNAKIEDLQQRIDSTAAEEVPLKAELQQAQIDLAAAQASVESLDDKYYKQLYSLPGESVVANTRIPLATNGRFTWLLGNDTFAADEKIRRFWIFSRATRADGRQYWALHNFKISPNQKVELILEPTGFLSTKAILRPDLSPEEQEQ